MSAPECLIIRSNGEFWGLDIVQDVQFTPDIMVATKPIDPGSSGGGSVVIDSVIETGLGFTIRGIMSMYPLQGAQTLTGFDREQRTRDFLSSIVGELVIVIVPRHPEFTDCLLAGYPWSLDGKLRTPFSISFRKNPIASSSVIVLPRVAPNAGGATPDDDIGDQATTPVSDSTQIVDESLGVQGLKGAGIIN